MNRTAAYPDDDLLTPSLTEADDAVGFERPWNPWSLVVLTFFAGIPAGGGLLALNFSRLGVPRKVLPALVAVILAMLLFAALRGWGLMHFSEDGQRQLFNLAQRALETVAAGAIAWTQRRRHRVFCGSGEVEGKLLLPGLIAAVLSFALQVPLAMLFTALFRR